VLCFETPRAEIDPLHDAKRSPPAARQHDPATSLYFLPKSIGEAFVLTVVVKQFQPAITAGNDVVVGPGELDTWRPRPSGCRSVKEDGSRTDSQ